MLRAISFRPVQAFTSGNPDRQGKVFPRQFEAHDKDILSKTPERKLTEDELKDVKKYVNLSARMFDEGDEELFKFMDEHNIRGLLFNPATRNAFKEAESQETERVEKIGLSEKEKQKIADIVDKYAQLFIDNPKTIKLSNTIQFAVDSGLAKLYCHFSTLPNGKNREKFYNDTYKQRISRMKKENPEAYAAYKRVSREDRRWAEVLYFSKNTDIENGFKLLFPDEN